MYVLTSALVVIPILAALLVLILPNQRHSVIRKIALSSSVLTLLISLILFLSYRSALGGVQFGHQIDCCHSFN